MGRKLAFQDDEHLVYSPSLGCLVSVWDITIPVVDGLCLLRPDDPFIDIFLGVLGYALEQWGFEVYGFHVMSTHWHLLAGFPDLRTRAAVTGFINGEVACRTNKLRGRSGHLFARRCRNIQVLGQAHALDRLRYLMSQGTKAFVVRHPAEDPFCSSNLALLQGKRLVGTWHSAKDGPVRYPVPIQQLPYLAHLDPAEYRAEMNRMADDIARECRVRRKKAGRRLQGAQAAKVLDPYTRIRPKARTPAPVVHGTREAEERWRERYADAESAYAEATRAFRRWQADMTQPLRPWPPCTLPPVFAPASRRGRPPRAGP